MKGQSRYSSVPHFPITSLTFIILDLKICFQTLHGRGWTNGESTAAQVTLRWHQCAGIKDDEQSAF